MVLNLVKIHLYKINNYDSMIQGKIRVILIIHTLIILNLKNNYDIKTCLLDLLGVYICNVISFLLRKMTIIK